VFQSNNLDVIVSFAREGITNELAAGARFGARPLQHGWAHRSPAWAPRFWELYTGRATCETELRARARRDPRRSYLQVPLGYRQGG
jgi:hypothetical protein